MSESTPGAARVAVVQVAENDNGTVLESILERLSTENKNFSVTEVYVNLNTTGRDSRQTARTVNGEPRDTPAGFFLLEIVGSLVGLSWGSYSTLVHIVNSIVNGTTPGSAN